MKVRVTFDLSDRQMIVLGIKSRNEMQRASREEAVHQITKIVDEVLAAGTNELDKITAEVISKLGVPSKS